MQQPPRAVCVRPDFDLMDLFDEDVMGMWDADSDGDEGEVSGESFLAVEESCLNITQQDSSPSMEVIKKRKRTEKDAQQSPLPTKRARHRKAQADRRWLSHGHIPRLNQSTKYTRGSGQWFTACIMEDLPCKNGGYTGMGRLKTAEVEPRNIEDAIRMGFRIVEANPNGSDTAIVDCKGRVIAAMVAKPQDATYEQSAQHAFKLMRDVYHTGEFSASDECHKRGSSFVAINAGLSYGNGHKQPSRLIHSERYQRIVDELCNDEYVQRLAAYQDAAYAMWHPQGYIYYLTNLRKLWEHHQALDHPNFPRSILPTVAFNIGDRVCTRRHLDSQNCPFGWCMVTALGEFDSKKGGHLILWELGIILEFPPGYCACLPSALISHSNLPVRADEFRLSFTQYCPGEVFRYVENGFKTDKGMKAANEVEFNIRAHLRRTRLKKGLDLFSTLDGLKSGRAYPAKASAVPFPDTHTSSLTQIALLFSSAHNNFRDIMASNLPPFMTRQGPLLELFKLAKIFPDVQKCTDMRDAIRKAYRKHISVEQTLSEQEKGFKAMICDLENSHGNAFVLETSYEAAELQLRNHITNIHKHERTRISKNAEPESDENDGEDPTPSDSDEDSVLSYVTDPRLPRTGPNTRSHRRDRGPSAGSASRNQQVFVEIQKKPEGSKKARNVDSAKTHIETHQPDLLPLLVATQKANFTIDKDFIEDYLKADPVFQVATFNHWSVAIKKTGIKEDVSLGRFHLLLSCFRRAWS
ncbi:hypothetical protein CVT24_012288 [Panaeolus cyanescens]|uniref:CxC2-like cysteine cluster KDZ transposase-associated domain-containing protein n=1 Tax=Panaeolus cyanescens TaxID=181874 RepID=A0A409YJ77_9AGAR|nr:hypothetical protein CVT24_012288 [Panaeolus cyanescens]